MSHARAAKLGWRRVDPKPWRKTSAIWRHERGWLIEHCGHPTANWPWAMYDRRGVLTLCCGRGWRTLEAAMTYVANEIKKDG